MASASLDTNVLLRLSLRDIPEQYEKAKLLVSAVPHTYVVSDAAIIEYIFALQHHYQLKRPEIATMVRWIVKLPTIVGDYSTVLAALDLYETHPQLSFTDCYLGEQAAQIDALPLWTFDKKLAHQHPNAQEV